MNIWLKTLLIALAGALGGAFWAMLAVVVCLKVLSLVDDFGLSFLIAFIVWPLPGVIGAAKTADLAGHYLDSFD